MFFGSEKGKTMTALEYMEKQIRQHRISLVHAVSRNAPTEMIENIRLKIEYYEKAVEALRIGEVVRCKDCKHYKPQHKSAHWNNVKLYCCRTASIKVNSDDFCSFGERKDNERKAD